jgi:hypothetical protein
VTVGIAALCERVGTNSIIVAADQQISRGFTSSQGALKMGPLIGPWMYLISGDNLTHAGRLIQAISGRLIDFDVSDFSRSQASDVLTEAQRDVAIEVAKEEALPPEMSLEWFYNEGSAKLPSQNFATIFNQLRNSSLGCDLLIAGFDNIGTAHIFTVGSSPPVDHDLMAFAAIGSGFPIALTVLSSYDHRPIASWQETAYRVFAAKRASERAEGVGSETTLVHVSANGLQWMKGETTTKLKRLYDDYGPEPGKKLADELWQEVGSLELSDKITGWAKRATASETSE